MRSPLEGRRREIGMKTVIRSLFVILLLLVGLQIPSQRVVPNVASQNLSLSPLVATEQEVRAFLGQYVDRYNKRDIEGFVWLFSLRAMQAQRDSQPELRMIY